MKSRKLTRRSKRTLVASGILWLTLSACSVGETDRAIQDRLAALEARESIRAIIYGYGRALDHRDFNAFAALFEPDEGTWVGGFGTATGRDAIFALMDERIGHAEEPFEPTSHHVFTNIEIDVAGDAASASTKWIFVVPSPEGTPQWRFLGHYDDRFVQREGRWYFLRREAFTDIPPP